MPRRLWRLTGDEKAPTPGTGRVSTRRRVEHCTHAGRVAMGRRPQAVPRSSGYAPGRPMKSGWSIIARWYPMVVLTPSTSNASSAAAERASASAPGIASHDELGEHRVVVRGHGATLPHEGVDAHVRTLGRRRPPRETARSREEPPLGVLGVDAPFDRVTAVRDGLRRERERLAGRDAKLLQHQVGAGHHLGHRVLDLDAGVHLDEVAALRLKGS